MKNILIYIIDRIQACAFGSLALLAAYGVIFKGAWWHIGTVLICIAVAKASLADARKEKTEECGWSKQDDHNPYPEE